MGKHKLWIAWVAVWTCGCMDAPAGKASSREAEQLAADGGTAWSEAGALLQPPLGHLPDASWCGAGQQPGKDPVRGGGGGEPIAAGDDASVAGGGGNAGTGSAFDAGPLIPVPAHAGDLVISELLADPGTLRDTQGEWFELYNPGAVALDLQGCSISNGGSQHHEIAEHVLAQPSAYLSIARDAAPGFVPNIVTSFSFTNGADVLVVSCGGVEIDRVAYDRAQGFPIKPGASMALDPAALDANANDAASAWCLSTASYGPELGTPGAANAACAASGGGAADASVP